MISYWGHHKQPSVEPQRRRTLSGASQATSITVTTQLYMPSETSFPIFVKVIDAIEIWNTASSTTSGLLMATRLSRKSGRIGFTIFEILQTRPPKGHNWVSESETKPNRRSGQVLEAPHGGPQCLRTQNEQQCKIGKTKKKQKMLHTSLRFLWKTKIKTTLFEKLEGSCEHQHRISSNAVYHITECGRRPPRPHAFEKKPCVFWKPKVKHFGTHTRITSQ